jgi:sarcosine oxidase
VGAQSLDVIVLGIGAMGSAALYHLAKRQLRVLGIERNDIAHDRGSSHGETRIIRLAYFQDPAYVTLAMRARQLWQELETESDQRLLVTCGSVDAGMPGSRVFEGALVSCVEHGLAHEVLTAEELSSRFPGCSLPPEIRAVFQPDGGLLLAERCVRSHARLAVAAGARVHTHERVISWAPSGTGFRVVTDRDSYDAGHLVFAAGPWMVDLMPELASSIIRERQVMAWFRPLRPELFLPERFPVINLLLDDAHCYACPWVSDLGFKCGVSHHMREVVDPETMSRDCTSADEALIRDALSPCFPNACGPIVQMKTCLYSNSPDEHFIIDRHPDFDRVIVAGACSGHGFKFASVIGETIADIVEHNRPKHDIAMFNLSRLRSAKQERR